MSERVLNVLVRDDAEIIVVTTSAGRVHAIRPAHEAYTKIDRLARSREDDETLLGLASGTLRPPRTKAPVELLLRDPTYTPFATDGEQVWFDDHRLPDAIASELLFLRSCLVDDEVTHDLQALMFFAEALVELDDEARREELVALHVKGLIHLDPQGRILVESSGVLFVAAPEDRATHILPVAHITSIRRRRGLVVFTVSKQPRRREQG